MLLTLFSLAQSMDSPNYEYTSTLEEIAFPSMVIHPAGIARAMFLISSPHALKEMVINLTNHLTIRNSVHNNHWITQNSQVGCFFDSHKGFRLL